MAALDRAIDDIIGILRAALPPDIAISAKDLERPPDDGMGDIALPCFAFAKALRRAPKDVAADIAAKAEPAGLIAGAAAAGPYVNFRFDRAAFAGAVMEEVRGSDAWYARTSGGGKVMIEYGQPNTHKEIHVGHLRNLALGLAIVRLARSQGRDVVPVSYIGDIGAHVAKCLWALRTFHAGEADTADKGKFLGAVYAEASRRVDEDPELKAAVAEVQRSLESREPEWDALWRETREWSIEEMRQIFGELGVAFDRVYYESEVEEDGKRMVRKMKDDGIAKEGEGGAIIVDLEDEDLGTFLALKSDGSSLYATKELALAVLKKKEFPDVAESLHVVDTRQSFYFRQFFATLRRLGFTQEMAHIGYEFVTLKEGAMSSRKGNIVTYEDFRDAMMDRVIEETRKRHEDWDDGKVRETAWAIAEAAMKFGMLKQDNDRPIVFDMEASLEFEGFTGPYVQYAHARLCSILAKAGDGPTRKVLGSDDPAEYALLRRIADMPQVVADAAAAYRPSLVAQYLFDLAQATSGFYRDAHVLTADDATRHRRLVVVAAARDALAQGLALLGIRAPSEM